MTVVIPSKKPLPKTWFLNGQNNFNLFDLPILNYTILTISYFKGLKTLIHVAYNFHAGYICV